MWQQVEAWRQVRADHRVELLVGGRWYLGCDLEWASGNHTMGRPQLVGCWVRPR